MRTIELGDKVKDKVSGFTGIVTSYTEYLTGCDRVGVSPDKLTKDGNIISPQSFDILELDVVKKDKVKVDKESKTKGGPRNINQKKS